MQSSGRDIAYPLLIFDLPKTSSSEKLHHDILILTTPRVKSRVVSQHRVAFHMEL